MHGVEGVDEAADHAGFGWVAFVQRGRVGEQQRGVDLAGEDAADERGLRVFHVASRCRLDGGQFGGVGDGAVADVAVADIGGGVAEDFCAAFE